MKIDIKKYVILRHLCRIISWFDETRRLFAVTQNDIYILLSYKYLYVLLYKKICILCGLIHNIHA